MILRFTEFIKLNQKELGLYIVQETSELNSIRFTIHIKNEENVIFGLYKELGKQWKMVSQNIPPWVNELSPFLTEAIENRILGVNTDQSW